MANKPRRSAGIPPEPTPPPLTTEEVTVPGVPPPETPLEPSPEELEARAAAEAQAEAERQRAEEEAAARVAAEVAAAAEAERQRLDAEAAAATRVKIDTCKSILRSYFNSVRRTTREDAVEWLERMQLIPNNISEAAFDSIVSESGFGKETVTRSKTVQVRVDEFFLKSPAA